MLPSEAYLAEQMAVSDPAAVHAARVSSCASVSRTHLRDEWLAAYEANRTPGEYRADAGRRRQSRR